DTVASVAFSPDGHWALSASTDRTVKLWEVATGRCLHLLAGHADPVHAVCWSAAGRFALSGAAQFLIRNETERVFTSGQLKLWDVAAGRCLPLFDGIGDAITCVCLSLDGRFALAGGGRSVIDHPTGRFAQSGQLQLWDVAAGKCLTSFEGHTGPVTSACLSADGR